MQENLEELEKTARDVGDAVKEAVAVGAEVMNDESASTKATDQTEKTTASKSGDSPFSNLKV